MRFFFSPCCKGRYRHPVVGSEGFLGNESCSTTYRAPHDKRVGDENNGEGDSREESEDRTTRADDLQRQHCSDKAARQHPEQQLLLPRVGVVNHPRAAQHAQVAREHDGSKNRDDGNDVVAAYEFGNMPSSTKKNERTRKVSSAWNATMRRP